MNSAMQLVFPAAILGSLLLASFGYTVMARVPVELLPADASQEISVGRDDLGSASEEANTQNEPAMPEETLVDSGRKPRCRVSDRFPENIKQWCRLITKYAEKHGFDPDLLAALIWQESGGNPTAYSKSGAVGLMQVMPRDGIAASFMCVNGPCFTNRPSIEALQDPEFNVKFGSAMLAGLIKKYGDTREALKYYGPMDVGYYYADKVLGIYNNYKR
jgi:hypothetical protein